MKKTISFLAATVVSAACGIGLYFCHKSGVLLGDGIDAFCYAAAMLGASFVTCLIIGLIFHAEVAGENDDVALWKVSLGVVIACVILGIMLVESPLPRIFSIDPQWVVTGQIGLPILINYCLILWAIFADKSHRPLYYSEENYIRRQAEKRLKYGGSSPTHTPTDPYGRPTGRGL